MAIGLNIVNFDDQTCRTMSSARFCIDMHVNQRAVDLSYISEELHWFHPVIVAPFIYYKLLFLNKIEKHNPVGQLIPTPPGLL
jgi:hypothetical protein